MRYPGVAAMVETVNSEIAEDKCSERITCQCLRKEKNTSLLCALHRWTHSPAKEMVKLLSIVIVGEGHVVSKELYFWGVE